MKQVHFTLASNPFASKCLVEMLRFSNKYQKGVCKREDSETLEGPWDIVVVIGLRNRNNDALVLDVVGENLHQIYKTVESLAKENGLL